MEKRGYPNNFMACPALFNRAVSPGSSQKMGVMPKNSPKRSAAVRTETVSGPVTLRILAGDDVCNRERTAASLASPCQMQLKYGTDRGPCFSPSQSKVCSGSTALSESVLPPCQRRHTQSVCQTAHGAFLAGQVF